MKSILQRMAILFLLLINTGCFSARRAIWNAAVGGGNRAEFKGTAGAGFAGVQLTEVLQLPVVAAEGVPDSVDLIANNRTSWRPALSTGLQVMAYSQTRSQAGGGLGVHMVFVPDAGGRTSPFPAVTMHFGNRDHEIFFGALFMRSDEIQFPNGEDRYRVAGTPGGTYPNFKLENSRSFTFSHPTLYMGIQIAGVRLGERYAQDAEEAAVGVPVADIRLEEPQVAEGSPLEVFVDQNVRLQVAVLAADDRELERRVQWFSENPEVARIVNNESILGVKADTTHITVTSGGIAKRFRVVVKERE